MHVVSTSKTFLARDMGRLAGSNQQRVQPGLADHAYRVRRHRDAATVAELIRVRARRPVRPVRRPTSDRQAGPREHPSHQGGPTNVDENHVPPGMRERVQRHRLPSLGLDPPHVLSTRRARPSIRRPATSSRPVRRIHLLTDLAPHGCRDMPIHQTSSTHQGQPAALRSPHISRSQTRLHSHHHQLVSQAHEESPPAGPRREPRVPRLRRGSRPGPPLPVPSRPGS